MDYILGQLGHAFVLLAFACSLGAVYSYFQAYRSNDQGWNRYARGLTITHAVAVLGVVVMLYIIIGGRHYEYFYAWSHSSNELPSEYVISAFWEGQEGSFLLWIFWNALLLLIVMFTQRKWENSSMIFGMGVQAFLLCMVLGVVLFGDLKLGSSPFILLRDAQPDAPIFKMNPEFVPDNGSGLNLLLQNYWMVIHPPTLFLGFAFTLIPFMFLMGGMLKGNLKEWVKPAFPWTVLGSAVLGAGIIMGGIWAYETLNFGGYWNWDPVENAVFVPWLIQVAGIHALLIYRKNGTALKGAAVLIVATFLLILYSTFLTRSGILGETSVHSFTDLGLSGQLMVFILLFVGLSIAFLVWRWKQFPTVTANSKMTVMSREFWIILGITILVLSAFQVIHFTSMPVYNSIASWFGIDSRLAPPSDQVAFYTQWQLWFGIGIALLSGTGQYFFWQKQTPERLWHNLSMPLLYSMLITGAIVIWGKIGNPVYMVLVLVSVYTIVSNSFSFIRLIKTKPKLVGGSLAHIGVGLMLLGVLTSAGFDNIVSTNNTGRLYHKDAPDEFNRDHLLLWQGKPTTSKGYTYLFRGSYIYGEEVADYVPTDVLALNPEKRKAIATRGVTNIPELSLAPGDTLSYNPENLYCRIQVSNENGNEFTIFPRIQRNAAMASSGNFVVSPDIKKFFTKDLYTYVSEFTQLVEDKKEWVDEGEITISLGDTFVVNDYVAKLDHVQRISTVPGVELEPSDAAVEARVLLYGELGVDTVKPLFVIKDKLIGKIPDENGAHGVRITLANILPETQEFILKNERTQKNYIIIHAIEKPFINLLWAGTVILILGFGVSSFRRFKDKGKKEPSLEKQEKETEELVV